MLENTLSWEIKELTDQSQLIKLNGAITETFDYQKILDRTPKECVRLDLSNINRINSCGVQRWIMFINELCPGRKVFLESCSPTMVNQINMIANMLGCAQIASVTLSYFCEMCENEVNILLEIKPDGENIIEEEIPCACGASLTFDDNPRGYLSFLTEPVA